MLNAFTQEFGAQGASYHNAVVRMAHQNNRKVEFGLYVQDEESDDLKLCRVMPGQTFEIIYSIFNTMGDSIKDAFSQVTRKAHYQNI